MLALMRWVPGVLLLCNTAAVLAEPVAPAPEQIEFFEKRIRPVLLSRCGECHSREAKAIKGELLLDTIAGIRKGGESGPLLVPGQPDKSLLIQALRYESYEMPPGGKLEPQVIADFVTWVQEGAGLPEGDDNPVVTQKQIDWEEAREHWAFQPISSPVPPQVNSAERMQTPVDAFVLAKLEERGMTLAPPADRRTLIRRVYFDLLGLPPTYEEVEEFVNDPSPDAYPRLIDRLLASPHYGERWGRHWLDVARYADTKDFVLLYGRDRIHPYSYTYRDYVVRAFNEDVPYDEFIHHQLAADKLSDGEPWQLAAMGFLTLGRMYDNNPPDIHDDQIDTVSRGLLGLTVSCARCHDHKYDAITTEDYYALYGIFSNSIRPTNRPLIESFPATPEVQEFEKALAAKQQDLDNFIANQHRELTLTARRRVGDYLVNVATEKPDPLATAVFFMSLSPGDLRPQILNGWRRYLSREARADHPVWGPWAELMRLPKEQFSAEASPVIERWKQQSEGTEPGTINPHVKAALNTVSLQSHADVARMYGELLWTTFEKFGQGQPSPETDPARDQLLQIMTAPGTPTVFPRSLAYLYMDRVPRSEYGSKLLEIDKFALNSPHAPPRAMSLVDSPEIHDQRVFVRGNPSRGGQQVSRRFLQLFTEDLDQSYPGSGRLELAKEITSPDNPLTSRVLVNRVWMYHFGEPLVSTPDDFGTRSTPPSHPELLDYLASTLQRREWSLKQLHREILLSATYQQSSVDRPDCRERDPENRWLWRYRHRRLDLESLRDSLLTFSGRLNSEMGGFPTEAAENPQDCRRTLYGLVDRQNLPVLYRSFDFANPDQSTARRPKTTVPQQALWAMNSEFVRLQAAGLAARPEVAEADSIEGRVIALYRIVFQRDPGPEELELAAGFLASTPAGQQTPLEQLAQVLLMSNELMYLD